MGNKRGVLFNEVAGKGMCTCNPENPLAGIYRDGYTGKIQPTSVSVTQPLSSSKYLCSLVYRNIFTLGQDLVSLSPVCMSEDHPCTQEIIK